MFKHLILLFLGFAALASAAFTPEKNFFFLPYDTHLSSQLFQTRHGIIAYSVDLMSNGQYAPHYSQINLETNNVTQIIPELPTACGQGPSIFDRFIYHALTYSFVYYCTNNNSILLLDPQNNFQVHQVFSLSISETFDEVRMITDGYSVTIVGMSGLLSPNLGPSHLIKFNLQNQQVVNHVVFDHGLAAGEFVSAYGTNGNFFIITNIINSTTNIANVYGMTLIGNSYTLTHLATLNSTSNTPYTIPEFYVIKDLIFTSNENTLVILDQNGNLQKVQEDVALYGFPHPKIPYPVRTAIVSYPGSGAFYVSLQNDTLLKFSVVNQGFTVEDLGLGSGVSLAIQDQLTDTLVFSFSGENSDFRITNADSGKVVYESVTGSLNFMITDKTYSVIDGPVKIFDRETNKLIHAIQFDASDEYYDQKSSTVFFLLDKGNDQNELQQIDLRTGKVYTLFSFNATNVSSLNLIHATNDETFDSPQFIIQMTTISGPTTSDEFLILSNTLGQVRFVVDSQSSSFVHSTLAVDYDTLDTFYFLATTDSPIGLESSVNVTAYSYVSSNDSFVSTMTNKYPTGNLSNVIPATDYSVIQISGKVVVIEMSSLDQTDYSIPTQWDEYLSSTFQNNSTGFKMIMSQSGWGVQESPSQIAGILSDNQIQELPGTTNSTVQAGVGGSCSYWVVNQVGCFGVVEFYNICKNDIVSEILA